MGGGTNHRRGRSQARRKLPHISTETPVLPTSTPERIGGAQAPQIESRDDDRDTVTHWPVKEIEGTSLSLSLPSSVQGCSKKSKDTESEDASIQWWTDYQRSKTDSSKDYPEVTSIPTDEIMDSFMKKPSATAISNGEEEEEEEEDNLSRETRDQYQLGRLQARIDQRREMMPYRQHIEEDDSPNNYKTLRSTRIKTVRNLYNYRNKADTKPNPNLKKSNSQSSTNYSEEAPSLMQGKTINSSTISSAELSEYREKIFDKMIQMLKDLSHQDKLQEDDLTHIKDTIIIESGVSCGGSAAELHQIQRLTEEEMTRILCEFEERNSLVASKDDKTKTLYVVLEDDGTPESFVEEDPPEIKMEVKKESKHKMELLPSLVFQDVGIMSITSKFSDVTSPTHHDGLELDEIMPVPHARSMNSFLPSTPYTRNLLLQQQSLSPVEAVAGEKAKAAQLGGYISPPQQLPSVIEDEIDDPSIIVLNGEEVDTKHTKDDKDAGSGETDSFVKGEEVHVESDQNTNISQVTEQGFHDDILQDHDEELNAVASILSNYEQQSANARRQKEAEFWNQLEEKAKLKAVEDEKKTTDHEDEKKVRFDVSKEEDEVNEEQQKLACGACTIQ